jgi:hypothetical protein
MKGTLSSTRTRPQTYNIRGAAGPVSRPVCHLLDIATTSFRENRPNSTFYFSSCLRSVTPVDFLFLPRPACAHIDAQNCLC